MGAYAAARPAPPGRAEIARATPAGSRVLRSLQAERRYLDALSQWEPLAALRADAREVTLSVAKWLSRHASWTDGTTRPGRALVCAMTGAVRGGGSALSWTAFKQARRRLEEWGFLRTVRAGSTAEFRPMALAHRDAPNEAPVYVLCLPLTTLRKTDETDTVAAGRDALKIMRPPTELLQSHTTPAEPRGGREAGKPRGAGCAGAHPGAAAAASAAAAAAAVARLVRKATGQRISEGWGAWLARPFTGWSEADLAWAIGHHPEGREHWQTQPVRQAGSWARYRLGLWLDAGGAPLPSRSQQLAAAGERRRAREDSRRAERARAAARRTDAGPHAARIRALGLHLPAGKRPVITWAAYATRADWKARAGGRACTGRIWQDGPAPGTIWAVPDTGGGQLYVVVHYDPAAPAGAYSLDTGQQ